MEDLLIFLVKLSKHQVTDEQKEVQVNGIQGHMDCKIDGEVIDIKTASGFVIAGLGYLEGCLHSYSKLKKCLGNHKKILLKTLLKSSPQAEGRILKITFP